MVKKMDYWFGPTITKYFGLLWGQWWPPLSTTKGRRVEGSGVSEVGNKQSDLLTLDSELSGLKHHDSFYM
jgi:hypothetical protein